MFGCSDFAVQQHVESIAAAHFQIAQDDVVLPFVELLYGNVPVRRLVDVVTRVGQGADDTSGAGNRDYRRPGYDPFFASHLRLTTTRFQLPA